MNLGDRMKLYEKVSERTFTRRVPLVIRCDGSCFHTWTIGLSRPFDANLKKCMEYAAYNLCKEISGAVFAYTQSDEISVLVIDYQDITTEPWFNYRSPKVESVSSAICTASFSEACHKLLPEHIKVKGTPFFDARAFSVPVSDVANYFLWRQEDCTKNSISSFAQAHFSHKDLHGKNSSDKQDMLMLQKGINWNDVPTRDKRGVSLYKIQVKSPNPVDPSKGDVIRNKWIADYEMPILSKDKEYVERWLCPDTVLTKNTEDTMCVCTKIDPQTIIKKGSV